MAQRIRGKPGPCRYCGKPKLLGYQLYAEKAGWDELGWSRTPLKVVTLDVRVRSFPTYNCASSSCIAFGWYKVERRELTEEPTI